MGTGGTGGTGGTRGMRDTRDTRDTRGMRDTRDTRGTRGTRPPQDGTGHGQGHGLSRAAYDELKPQLLLATIAALLIGVAYLLLPPALRVGSTVLPSWLLLAVDAVVLRLFPAAAA